MKIILALVLLLAPFLSQAQNGIVKGTVTDASSHQPIPFANVIIQGTTTGSATDLDGLFTIAGLKPALYNIEVSYIGYKGKTVFEVQVLNNKPAELNIELEPDARVLAEVEVTANPFEKKEESPVSLRTIGVNEIERNPGGNRDISKALQSLPGVASSVAFRNDIIIRGGAPNENRFYLDGIEVPNINHFATQGSSGGPVGMINVNFIREVDFYSGAFPANRGNALSSVLAFKMKDPRTDRIGGNVTIGASDFGATVEGPIAKGHSFMFSYRRSYLQFLFKALGLPFLPIYNDFQLKYKWKVNDRNEVTLISLAAIDNFELNLDANETEDQRYLLGILPVNEQWNYTVGINWKNYRDHGFSEVVVSRNMLNNEAFKYLDNVNLPENLILNYASQEIENKVRAENNWQKDGWKLNYGFGYEYVRYNNRSYFLVTAPTGAINEVNFSSAIDLHKWSVFGQLSKKLMDGRLLLSLGVRADGNSFNRTMARTYETFSPRFSASYAINDHFRLNANVGRYFQLPPYTLLGYRSNAGTLVNRDNQVSYIACNHAVAGVEYVSRTALKVSVEGFFKYWQKYPFITSDSITLANLGADFGAIGNDPAVSRSDGRSYGLEVLVQQKLWKGFYGILAYTFVRSEFQDKKFEYVPSAWDNRHLISLTAGKKFKYNFELGVRWRFIGGTPYTPANVDLYSIIPVWDAFRQTLPNYDQLNTQRLDAAHTLDMRIDKKFFFKKWSLNLYIDVQNVYNFQAQQAPIYRPVLDSNGANTIDPNDPTRYQMQRVNNPAGSVIPSFGVVVEI